MSGDTAKLIRALGAVNQHLPRMVNDVLLGQMSPDKQREFAELLIELGESLHRHADPEKAEDAEAADDSAARATTPPEGFPQLTDSEEEQL